MRTSVLIPLAFIPGALGAQDRPNILWLTFEDTSPYELGCYGNRANPTPLIDSLGRVGIRYANAYSGGPQSSPSRSTLITGAYCTTYGMDWHRGRVDTPDDIFFPQYLRDEGYYCTNNQKTDYNTSLPNNICWDECGPNASYNSSSRAEGQPFFAVFNSQLTHMSRMCSVHTDGRRDFSKEGFEPSTMPLPPHVPDLPEVYSDYAFHVEGVSDVDRWVRIFIDDLKARGLYDNTIIFIFSDHGGCLPRGKAFAYETSFRVPMVAYYPPRWKHLEGNSDRMVNFVDMGPSMLSLAGIPAPAYMQGTAFCGRFQGPERKRQIGIMSNRTIHFAPARTISDGRYKYIRYYIPYKKDALYNYFQWEMPANIYWDKAYLEGKLSAVHRRPYEYAPAESFYDLRKDPYELNDLSSRGGRRFEALKAELSEHIRSTMDAGLIPITLRSGTNPHERMRELDSEKLFSLCELTATVSEKDLPMLEAIATGAEEPEYKFWAAVNLGVLTRQGCEGAIPALKALLCCEDSMTAQEAAAALCYTSAKDEAFVFLLTRPKETIALEMLSLDPQIKNLFPEDIIKILQKSSGAYERKASADMPKGQEGINQRKVLVNLGLLKSEDLYGPNVYEAGLEVNRNRRPLNPKP